MLHGTNDEKQILHFVVSVYQITNEWGDSVCTDNMHVIATTHLEI